MVPKTELSLTSTSSITVSSRSSSNTLTKGWLKRAVTFQSISRTSSPNWYSLTSLKDMPLPLKALWYSPEKIWLERPLVFISRRLTFLSISAVSTLLINNEQLKINNAGLGSWYFYSIEDLAQDVL